MSTLEFRRLLLLNDIAKQIAGVSLDPKQTKLIQISIPGTLDDILVQNLLLLNATAEISQSVEERLKGSQTIPRIPIEEQRNPVKRPISVHVQSSVPLNDVSQTQTKPTRLQLPPNVILSRTNNSQESNGARRGDQTPSTSSELIGTTPTEGTPNADLEKDSSIQESQEKRVSKEDHNEKRSNDKNHEGRDMYNPKRVSSPNTSTESKRKKGIPFDSKVFVEFPKSSSPQSCENLSHYCTIPITHPV
jgi:hypothetical protein